MHQDPVVVFTDARRAPDLLYLKVEPLSHHENAALLCRQFFDASFQDAEKIHLMQASFWIPPNAWGLSPVTVCDKQGVYEVLFVNFFAELNLIHRHAKLINKLVLQYPKDPSLQLTPAAKARRLREYREHCF